MTTAPNTAVLWMPQGSGKSTHAQAIAALLGCTHVVDEWSPGARMQPGALHLTNAPMTGYVAAKLPLAVIAYLKTVTEAHPFVTIGEIARACRMVPLTSSDEALLRKALEDAGCVKAKRTAGDGTRQWGYLSPYHLSVATVLPSALHEPPATPDTPQSPSPACSRCTCRSVAGPTPPAALPPVEPPAPTKPGQCPLCPCSASPECENGSLQTGGAA